MDRNCFRASGHALRMVLEAIALCITAGAADPNGYYVEPQLFALRPDPARERPFGYIGVTGVMARIYPGATVKVESTVPGSPAEGKFKKGEIITGVNGVPHRGRNLFVVFGEALTNAEATDGKLIFDVTSADGQAERKETVTIPVLGAYSKTWPLNCSKSKKIIEQTAEYYADPKKFKLQFEPDLAKEDSPIPCALTCLFLLSTGDDKYLPRVKAYFDSFPKDVQKIGEHTWNNGYNGIACGEYYLRTGDASVLPVLQYFCDDAKKRQKFGRGWTHWSNDIHPRYVAGGLMNPAGSQMLTTLLLGKECGVNVDDETLLGSLRYFYRFAGRGTVPYGDHRGEGGLGSNGKDGMIAAAMQIACGAKGDVTIYEEARRYLALSMIASYPCMVRGHADDGRGDSIWRSIVTSYLMNEKPDLYRESMDRLAWWHDLSREPGGSVGFATLEWENGVIASSGPGAALSYTAPLKTLRITGAPRSKFSKDFTLPERLWGTEADRAFLSIERNPKYFEYGKDEPTHIPFYVLGNAYSQPKDAIKTLPREVLLKNLYHENYLIRTQAAKALRAVEAFDELEKLLSHSDPRIRRAGLDGLTDYNYWFAAGKNPIPTAKFTPGMVEAIRKMLSDPKESWWVVDGALMALKFAPAKDIQESKTLILPWTKHSDWWLRESSFMALSGLEKDENLYPEIVPTLLEIMTSEYHTMPRERMVGHLERALKNWKPGSPVGKLIMAGLMKAVEASEIKPGVRSSEGAFNVAEVAKACLQNDPATAVTVAQAMRERFGVLGTGDIVGLVGAPRSNPENTPFGLYSLLEKQSPQQKEQLTDLLFNEYRTELIKRMSAEKGENLALIDTIIDLTQLKKPVAGWKPLGQVAPADRVWRFTSFDPQTEKDQMHPREKKRFRDIQLPGELKGWETVEYDDSKWPTGRAPIGLGDCSRNRVSFKNNSAWGKGEFIVMRTTFDLDAIDCDKYRLSILARQGFHVYLNGQKIHTYEWWKDMPHYRPIELSADQVKFLKKGTNILAAYGTLEYDPKTQEPRGQMDLFIEGLKMADLKQP